MWEGAGINGNTPNASKMSQTAGHQVHDSYSDSYKEESIRIRITLVNSVCQLCVEICEVLELFSKVDRVFLLALGPIEQLTIKMQLKNEK